MRAGWIVVAGVVVSGLSACGGDDGNDLFGSGGSSTGGSSNTGGSTSSGGAESGGASGSGTGGSSASGGTTSGGAGGTTSGGAGGTTSGGAGGSISGGAGGSISGGAGGTTSGGAGGTTSGGAGGTTGGTGGAATGGTGGCTQKVWCKDNDNDTYGAPTGLVYSCDKPSGNWVQSGSKAEACGDCNDNRAEAKPFSNFCGAQGYQTPNGTTSFDFNCDGQEIPCSNLQKAGTCKLDPTSFSCSGAGYLPVPGSTSKNPYCGSSEWQDCTMFSTGMDGGMGTCNPSKKTVNHVTCK